MMVDITTNNALHSYRWWQMLGYDKNIDITNPKHWQTLTHPNDIESASCCLREVIDSKQNHYEHGTAILISGTNTDMTEFKKADREIVILNRLLSMIIKTNQLITRKPGSLIQFNELCKIAVNDGGFNFAWVGLLMQDKDHLKCVTYAGPSTSFIESLDHNLQKHDYNIPAIKCISEGQYIICNDLNSADYEEHWVASALESGYRSMVALPVALDGKVVGNFSLFSNEKQAFGQKEISLLDELASDISFALEIEDSENLRKKPKRH